MRAPFYRLVREITQYHLVYGQVSRFEIDVLAVHEEVTEYYSVSLWDDANLCAIHIKQVTLMPMDIWLVRRI